jgi:hypothetical protein
LNKDPRTFSWDSISPKSLVSADPAAGDSGITILTVPAGKRVRIEGITFYYARSATAANVYMELDITDGAGIIGDSISLVCDTVSTSHRIYFSRGISVAVKYNQVGVGYYHNVPMVLADVPSGGNITMTFLNKHAADDCGVIRMSYKEAPA